MKSLLITSPATHYPPPHSHPHRPHPLPPPPPSSTPQTPSSPLPTPHSPLPTPNSPNSPNSPTPHSSPNCEHHIYLPFMVGLHLFQQLGCFKTYFIQHQHYVIIGTSLKRQQIDTKPIFLYNKTDEHYIILIT